MVLEVVRLRSGHQYGWDFLPHLQTAAFLLCSHVAEGERRERQSKGQREWARANRDLPSSGHWSHPEDPSLRTCLNWIIFQRPHPKHHHTGDPCFKSPSEAAWEAIHLWYPTFHFLGVGAPVCPSQKLTQVSHFPPPLFELFPSKQSHSMKLILSWLSPAPLGTTCNRHPLNADYNVFLPICLAPGEAEFQNKPPMVVTPL